MPENFMRQLSVPMRFCGRHETTNFSCVGGALNVFFGMRQGGIQISCLPKIRIKHHKTKACGDKTFCQAKVGINERDEVSDQRMESRARIRCRIRPVPGISVQKLAQEREKEVETVIPWPRGKYNGMAITGITMKMVIDLSFYKLSVSCNYGEPYLHVGPLHFWFELTYRENV